MHDGVSETYRERLITYYFLKTKMYNFLNTVQGLTGKTGFKFRVSSAATTKVLDITFWASTTAVQYEDAPLTSEDVDDEYPGASHEDVVRATKLI